MTQALVLSEWKSPYPSRRARGALEIRGVLRARCTKGGECGVAGVQVLPSDGCVAFPKRNRHLLFRGCLQVLRVSRCYLRSVL